MKVSIRCDIVFDMGCYNQEWQDDFIETLNKRNIEYIESKNGDPVLIIRPLTEET